MLLTDKVSQFATDSNTVHAWVNGPASGIGSSVSTSAGLVRTPAKLIADKSVDVDNATNAAIAGNIVIVNTVANSIDAVDAAYDNLALIQSAPANAFIASESAAYISTFVDAITLRDMTFPLDLGLVTDPVPLTNHFDLGAI